MLNNNFVRIGLGTLALLSIPFMAMQFNWQVPDPGSSSQDGVNWTLSDFIIMGVLLFGTGSLINIVMTKMGKYRFAAAAVIVFLFLWLWAELAVGVFTNWGS